MDRLAILLNGSNMSISPFGTFHFALTVVSCHSTMPYLKGSRSCTIENDLVSYYPTYVIRKVPGYPGANRREVRKLGLLLSSKSSEAERERMEPPEWNKRVCEGWSDTCMTLMTNPGLSVQLAGRGCTVMCTLFLSRLLWNPGGIVSQSGLHVYGAGGPFVQGLLPYAVKNFYPSKNG
ncbi:MAG: hypothetical protein A4E65_00933 [Syntrophorhabdus sp. PtaU1.Bin153]|nr:MAG: hypothetical protein A4E65_00933 [Syntrophorhabdus sp. PtaU1.Bin153]